MKRRRLPALLLAAALLLTIPAQAAQGGGHGFVRARAYDGRFSDLTTASPFYDNVAALYEYGLTEGRTDGTYGLRDPMTVGEVAIFAGRIRSIYRTGSPEPPANVYGTEGGSTSLRYLRYLQVEGVLGSELDLRLNQPAARGEVAHVLARVLPAEALPLINDQAVTEGYASGNYITDVTRYTPYAQDILLLYRAGITVGGDGTGSFQPEAPVTRGAAAAMLTRVVDPSLRLRLDWPVTGSAGGGTGNAGNAGNTGNTGSAGSTGDAGNTGGSYAGGGETTLADLVPYGTYLPDPGTLEELIDDVQYMLSSGSNVLALQYNGITTAEVQALMEDALGIVKSYCEQSYNEVHCSYNQAGRVTLTFSAAGQGDRIQAYRETALDAALEVRRQLWESGALDAGMSDREKALVYFDWICQNCTYDYRAGDSSVSHIPYGLFANGTAVCDGYTGAYNLFLKLEGIPCVGLSGEGHIWTVAELDGERVHIDVTWGDTGPAVNHDYFAMTEAESWAEHTW